MNKLSILAAAFLFTTVLCGQDKFSFCVGGEYSENFSIRNYAGTLQVEVPVGDRLGLNYKLNLGASSDKAFYLHAPVGAAFGTILLHTLGNSNSSAINAIGALLIIVPEGITFYPNPENRVRAGIYVAPLGCDYWHKRSDYEYFRLSGEAGGKVKIPLGSNDRMDLQLQGGIRYLYRNKAVDPFFLHAGAGIAFHL
jgi:hypothetical protein